MESSKQLAERFRGVVLNGKWIANINFKEAIEDLSWQEATDRIGDHNSIAALTFHVNYYVAGVLNVFKGGNLEIRDKYSFDFEEITSQEQWDDLRKALLNNSEEFARQVEVMSEEMLDSHFVDEKYGSYRRNIEGMIEHCYYHLGQVALLKKLINN